MPLENLAEQIDDHVDIDDAIATLTETTTAALTKQSGDVKSLRDHLAKLEAKMGRPGLAANDNNIGGLRHDNDNVLGAEKKALGEFIRHDVAIKSMSVGSDPDGGYGVTPQLSQDIVRRLYNLSPIRQICRVVEVGSFDSYAEPMQIGDVGATWVGESQARPGTATPTLGLLTIPVNEIYSLQPITQRLLDDSRFDMASFVTERVSERMARAEGTAFVNGNGLLQPMGFMNYPTDPAADFTRSHNSLQYVVSGNATNVALDGIKNLYWTLRAPHRANASWVMSSATASSLDTLKDLNGRYLWRDSVTADAPPTLLGRPVYFSEDMAAVGAGTFPIAFGNFQAGYVIADKPGIRFLRDPFSSKPNVIIYAYARVGGGVSDTDAIKVLKIST
jgi:HK97 family phage major capsid protein